MADWFTHDDRRRLLGIDEETFRLLRQAAPLLERNAGRMVAGFYDRISHVPGLVELIGRHSTRKRLEATLTQYIRDLGATRLDAAHIASLETIAAASEEVAAAASETGRASGEVARLAEEVKRIADGMELAPLA